MKKTLSLLLALLLLAVLLTACGSRSSGSAATSTNLQPTEAVDSDTAAAPPVTKPQYVLTSYSDLTRLKDNVYVLLAPDPAANAAGAVALTSWLLSFDGGDLLERFAARNPGLGLGLCEAAQLAEVSISAATEETRCVRLALDPAALDAGFLDFMLPVFEADYGYEPILIAASADEAAELVRQGEADLLLFPAAKAAELTETKLTATAFPWLQMG